MLVYVQIQLVSQLRTYVCYFTYLLHSCMHISYLSYLKSYKFSGVSFFVSIAIVHLIKYAFLPRCEVNVDLLCVSCICISVWIMNTTRSKLGLGGTAILVLDISCRKAAIYQGSYKSRWIDYSIRVFQSFSSIWFCKYWAFVFSNLAITYLLASKRVSRHGKTSIILNTITLFL